MRKIILTVTVWIPFVATILIAYWLYELYVNIAVDYKITNISLKNILKNQIDLTLFTAIQNNSGSSIKAKNVTINIYYKNELVATVDNQDLAINKGGVSQFSLPVTLKILLDGNTGELIKLFVDKKPVDLLIKIKAKIYKIPVYYSTNYTYEP